MDEIVKITLLHANTDDLLADFKKYLEEEKEKRKNTYVYGGSYLSNRELKDERDVFIYEESDVTRTPLQFKKVSEFKEWAEGKKIYMSEYTLNALKGNEFNYVTCYPGCLTLMIRQSYSELKSAAERYYKYNQSYGNYDDDDLYGSVWY